MAVSLFASLGAFLGEFLGDPTLARWQRKRLIEKLRPMRRRGRATSSALPNYLHLLTPLDGPPPTDTPAMLALWSGSMAAADQASSGDRALTGMALYSRGLNLWEPEVARRGLAALLGEAEVGCLRSGMWNEDSTIRHLQMTANYAAAWLLAADMRGPKAMPWRRLRAPCWG